MSHVGTTKKPRTSCDEAHWESSTNADSFPRDPHRGASGVCASGLPSLWSSSTTAVKSLVSSKTIGENSDSYREKMSDTPVTASPSDQVLKQPISPTSADLATEVYREEILGVPNTEIVAPNGVPEVRSEVGTSCNRSAKQNDLVSAFNAFEQCLLAASFSDDEIADIEEFHDEPDVRLHSETQRSSSARKIPVEKSKQAEQKSRIQTHIVSQNSSDSQIIAKPELSKSRSSAPQSKWSKYMEEKKSDSSSDEDENFLQSDLFACVSQTSTTEDDSQF